MDKLYITWQQVENYIKGLENYLKDKNIIGVYAVPKGGLVLGTMIAHRLHIPMLLAPCENCLVIDDIIDTGDTLYRYRNADTRKIHLSAMFCERESKVYPDIVYDEKIKEKDCWIVFPWENKETEEDYDS